MSIEGVSVARSASAEIIVAIAGSAARTGSLEALLSQLQMTDRMAAVVVLQHREALDEARLRDRLSDAGVRLDPVADGAPIEPGHVYLPDANLILGAVDGHFEARPATQSPGERGTIDSFLASLAKNEEGRVIAVLLDGTGGDGTLGVAAVKEAGGLTLAEETETHRSGELASSNSPAAISDVLLPANALADRVALLARHFGQQNQLKEAVDEAELVSALTSIAGILRNRTGHDFHGYKRGTFLRRVHRRMQVTQVESIGDYVDLLRQDAEEAQLFFNDLLIGVTQFFRDKKEFELLEREVVPKLFKGKAPADQLRVWVIGCSTGEEAYSVAILLREHMAGLNEVPQVQIFGSDLDGRALASARAGRYTRSIENDVSPERLGRWFIREGDTYCISKEIREMCIFSQHSIIKDAPFSRLDLVSCRNLLIYLDAEVQSRVIPVFHFALKPGGFLFLGNSENVSRHLTLFAPIEPRSRIFRRLETATRTLPDFPFTAVDRRLLESTATLPRVRPGDGMLARRAERIAERYAPAYVVIDDAFNVLHFSGRTGRFLDPAGGAASLNLLSLVHSDLRPDLRSALARAAEQTPSVQVNNLQIRVNGHSMIVEMVVERMQKDSGQDLGYVVLFRDGPALAGGGDDPLSNTVPAEHVLQLETDLRSTKDRLQATIEELESTNEELKSSNEEYQSLNEELQSANEELETSKEELQSVNEELTTVNGELAHRVQELGRANSDLKNLLESTQIATIFLDNQLRVMNFTPAVSELFHLVDADVGRPIGHIKSRISYEELQDDVQRVLRTLGSVEREIASESTGKRYMTRALPYRSVDNFIGGVVITFTDVTPLTKAQQALLESEKHARLLLAELQHRVRNTLGVIRSIARRTGATSETVEDYAMHLDGRIDAFARVQASLTRHPAAGIDLEMLVADELLAHGAQERHQVASIAGPKVRLKAKTAETMALAIHELSTNAVKYGALASRSGRINVEWAVESGEDESRLVIRWTELGVSLSGEQPDRRGFGMELLERTLAYDLGGEAKLRFERDGLHCEISVPFNERSFVVDRTWPPA
jgi:two-component system, chemotaxis family, CheB/CheR fusion protein